LKDSRVKRNREHLLAEILLIAIAMKRVWIMDISIWYRHWCGTPIRWHPPSKLVRV